MLTSTEKQMGRFSVEVELINDEDLSRARRGEIPPDQVRRTKVRGVVDSGATRLVIPESVAKQLGLEPTKTMVVRYADGRTADRQIVEHVRLSFIGRDSVFDAIIEPNRESALIGAVVMELLDLVVDCTARELVPRDPSGIISEIE